MKTQVDVSYQDALEIIFASRNRAYGAYQLRRQYPTILARALGFGLLIIGLLLAAPHLISAFSTLLPVEEKEDTVYKITEVYLKPPPVKPPEIPATPPPARNTQRFVPPVVDQDKNVEEAPDKLSNDVLTQSNADIGTQNVQVATVAAPSLDDPTLGGVIETPASAPSDDPVEFVDLQKSPSFPGGENALLQYLSKNIQYPELAREANLQGLVVLSFIIGKDGSLNDITIVKDLGGGCGREAVRVIKNMPHWTPGESNGRAVRVRFVLPVRFRLQ